MSAAPPDDPATTCALPASVFGVFAAGRAFDRDAESLAAAYEAGLPFPHFVAEGLFEEAFLAEVVRELPHPSQGEGFVRNDLPDRQVLKFAYRSEAHLGPRSRHLISVLHSKTFLDFLSKVTGIADLVPDAHLCGGGFQQTLPGGRLYYYSNGRPEAERSAPHSTLWQTRPEDAT